MNTQINLLKEELTEIKVDQDKKIEEHENQRVSEERLPSPQAKKQRKHRKRKRNFQDYEEPEKIQKEDRNYFSNSMKIFLKYIKDLKKTKPKQI